MTSNTPNSSFFLPTDDSLRASPAEPSDVNETTLLYPTTSFIPDDDDTALPTRSPRRPVTLDDILGQYVEYKISLGFTRYGFPIVIFLGTVGNLFTFLVMLKPTMRKSSTCFYMAVLAMFDTSVLYFSCFRQWIALLDGTDALNLTSTSCKSLNFFSYTCFDLAVWILVAMTIERCFAVHFPLKATDIATIPIARKTVCLIVLIMASINLHFFWTVELDARGRCSYLEQYTDFHDEVWPWLDATVYSFLPFVALLISNSIIIYDSRRAFVKRRSELGSNASHGTKGSSVTRFQFRLSAMLVTVSVVFLILSAPNVILICIRHKYFDFSEGVDDFHDIAVYQLVSTVTSFCLYINHAVNFILYCVSGQRFRTELLRLLRCRWKTRQTRRLAFSDVVSSVQRLSEANTASQQTSTTAVDNNALSEEYTYM